MHLLLKTLLGSIAIIVFGCLLLWTTHLRMRSGVLPLWVLMCLRHNRLLIVLQSLFVLFTLVVDDDLCVFKFGSLYEIRKIWMYLEILSVQKYSFKFLWVLVYKCFFLGDKQVILVAVMCIDLADKTKRVNE